MTKVQHSIEIRAPQAAVFAGITDPRRTLEWNPNIVDVRDVSTAEPGVDTTWRQTAMIAGRPLELHCRIALWDPPRTGTLQISGAQRATVVTECIDLGRSTRVVQTIDFEPPGGFLGGLAGPLIGQQLRRELERSLHRQRAALEGESGRTDGSPSL